MVLVGGDEDLRRALEEAQDYGVRVHLWGVEAAAPEYNQSQSLIAEADRRWVIPGDWVSRFVRLPDALATAALTAGEERADEDDASATLTDERAVVAFAAPPMGASPADLARLVAAYRKDSAGAPGSLPANRGWEVRLAEQEEVPRLRDLTTARHTWVDNEQDTTETTGNPAEVGARFGARWASRATAEQRAALIALRPQAPRHLDGELLRYAERVGIDTWEDEPAKFAGARWILGGSDGPKPD